MSTASPAVVTDLAQNTPVILVNVLTMIVVLGALSYTSTINVAILFVTQRFKTALTVLALVEIGYVLTTHPKGSVSLIAQRSCTYRAI